MYPHHNVRLKPKRSRDILGDILGSIVSPLLKGVTSVLSVFVKTIVKEVLGMIKQYFPGLNTMLSFGIGLYDKLYNTIITTIVKGSNVICNTIKSGTKALMRLVNSFVVGVFKTLNSMMDVVTNILTGIEIATSYFADGLSIIVNRMSTSIDNIFKGGDLSNEGVINKFTDNVTQHMHVVFTEVGSTVRNVNITLHEYVKALYKLHHDYIERFGASLRSSFCNVKLQLELAKRSVDETLSNVTNPLADALNVTSDVVVGASNAVNESVKSLTRKIDKATDFSVTVDSIVSIRDVGKGLTTKLVFGAAIGSTIASFIL